jgi:hypothetical protein
MDFNFEMLKEAFTAATAALGLAKQIKDSLPQGSKKDEVDEALQKAERHLKLAESQIAEGLSYQLCRNHFPPEIMHSADERNWSCPQCGNEKHPPPPDGWFARGLYQHGVQLRNSDK